MTDLAWPGDNRCAAWFTFDLDADETWNLRRAADDAWDKPTIATRGRYGPEVAVPRILELFDRYDLAATFFVPGKVAEDWPAVVQRIHEAGHEIGHHGYRHVNPADFDREEEAAELRRALDVFDDLLGETPVGYRSPAADLSANTLDLLAEHGLRYDSSFIDDDQPYLHGTADGPLVEIPFDWSVDDWPYFGFQMYPQLPYQSGITPAPAVFEGWRQEFRGLHRRGRCFVLTMHPQLIGRAGRIDALEGLLEEVVGTGDTWVATGAQIADHVLEAAG